MSGVRTVILWGLAGFLILFGLLFWLSGKHPVTGQGALDLPQSCQVETFEAAEFIVCRTQPDRHRIRLALRDAGGKPWRSLDRLAAAGAAEDKPVLFAMNAGMYHEDMSPVGLYIEDGKEIAPLQTGTGGGNFFMKPNGVFGITAEGKPFVVSTDAFALSKPAAAFATQSGPMLVLDSRIHPQFEPDGVSRFIRNGVGVDGQGQAIFAMALSPVSFGVFARLFKDRLSCPNALYFDGVVSAFSNGSKTIAGGGYPAGPIVSVTAQ